MNARLLNVLKFLVFLSVGLGILYWVYAKQDAAYQAQCALDGIAAEDCSLVDKVWQDFRSTNPFWLLVVLLAFMVSNISRALRWQMLIAPLGYRTRLLNGFGTIMMGYFFNLFLPRAGEVVRIGTMARYERVPLEKLTGTLVVDRILDVISLLTVVGLAFLLEADTLMAYLQREAGGEKVSLLLLVLLGGVLALVAALLLFVLFRERLRQVAFYNKLKQILIGFWEGLQSIRYVRRPWWFVFHSLNIWLMYFFMTYLCFFAFAPTASLGPLAGLVVFVFGSFGIVIPSPGGMGTYHFLVIQALAVYGIGSGDAFSFANILFFSLSIFCNIAFGLLAVLYLPRYNRHYRPVHSGVVAEP